jgi:hypothetical protein
MANDLVNITAKELAAKGAKQVLNSASPLSAINDIAGHVQQWRTIKEQEKTKRHDISANRDIIIEDIRARRDVFIKSLEMNYRERATVYDNLFKALDSALESGNVDMASLAMGGIVEQIKNNPLPSFGEFQKAFMSNQPIDF